jgi:hemerythrin-like domain-containing protein
MIVTTMAIPLPGFSAPAAGFDEPLAMLHACHDRVRRSLGLLQRICERVRERRIDDAVRDAAIDVLRYFDRAAPLHHEDEERHIFPAVRAGAADSITRNALVRLQEQHLLMAAGWAVLREPLSALAAGDAAAFGPAECEAASRFIALYHDHAAVEEMLIFPAAAALLDHDALARAGAVMAHRRGVTLPQA